ncbi:SpoIIE family protein phosphatase [Streptomyces sp. NPDC049040]|uniref:SpoIIE family protein phosphatase n=1 Tax=Streptomyces sp. NPDC049040 TaxID=3365593 RepID=UPI0037239FBD
MSHSHRHPDLEVLDTFLYDVLRETGAYSGGIFLLPAGEQVLGLAVEAGMPDAFVRPWRRLWLDMRTPVTDAARERRLIWLPVGETTRYSSPTAVVLPYRFGSVSAPIAEDDTVWGSITLLFPASQPPRLAPRQHAAIESCCRSLGRLLADASAQGHPLLPGPEPRTMRNSPADTLTEADTAAAVDFARRLPEGGMALDTEGQITFVTPTAAGLLGVPVEGLRGRRLWQLLPWLSDAVFEDRFREALFSREPTAFTALRPPGTTLSFTIFPGDHRPGDSGVSVRVTSAEQRPRPEPPPPEAAGGHRSDPAAAGGSDRPEHSPDPGTAPASAPAPAGSMYEIMNLAAMLTQAVEVADLVELVAEPITTMFDAQGLALLALEDGRLKNIGHRGYDVQAIRRLDGAQMRWMPTPASRALGHREATFYSTPEEMDAVYAGMSTLTGKSAWAYLPLIASDRPVGCCVMAFDRPRTFTSDQRAILASLGGLLAQALDRALVHDARYQFARRLQTGFLPSTLPKVPGLRVAARYQAAAHGMEIGGDFYDLIGLCGTGAAAAIGDVQGHNPTAAALMGQVRTAVHASAGAPPAEVLERTNRLLNDLDAGLFTSCLYAHLDLRARSVRLASAGHPPPLLRHPDGTVSVVQVPPGPLLGIVRAAEYPTVEIPLPPGAELLLYTDGLVEIPGEDPDVSTARLARTLADTPAGESLDARADLLLKNAPSAAAGTDDIALLLIGAD